MALTLQEIRLPSLVRPDAQQWRFRHCVSWRFSVGFRFANV